MSIEFVDPKGNPVVIQRPELVVALRSYTRPHPETGEVLTHTIVLFENREAVFVASHPAVVSEAIEAHATVGSMRQVVPEKPSWPWPDCPHKECPTPKSQCSHGCKVVKAEREIDDNVDAVGRIR